ncbi:MAG: LLM class flavin-dependent oxidoreductase [Nocardioides sp.]
MTDLPLLGFGLPVSGSWATPATMLHLAQRAEALGYASLWTFQRTLVPVGGSAASHDAVGRPAARAVDAPAYQAVQDAVLPLAFVAARTERIGLGTATLCAPFTAPAMLAKAMTTLDQLSAGRLTIGLGIGWLPEEYAAAGVPFARRGARMEEHSAAWRRCGHRTRHSSTVSSTPCPARGWASRPSSARIRPSCSVGRRRRRCAGPAGWPRAGSAAVGRT